MEATFSLETTFAAVVQSLTVLLIPSVREVACSWDSMSRRSFREAVSGEVTQQAYQQ